MVVSGANDRTPSQPQQHTSASRDSPARLSGNRPGTLTSGPYGSSRPQRQWEPAQGFSRQGPQQISTGFMPGSQPLWPPGSVPYMQPQVFVYPNPPGFYPQPLPGAQRPIPQMMPQVGMMLPPQQYPGVNSMFSYGVAPSPTPEQWLHARNMRPPAPVYHGVRPTGWGGVPFQSPNDPRWQSASKPLTASMPLQRPIKPSPQQQPPPPPPRSPSFPQLPQMDRQPGQTSLKPSVSEAQQANRASSTSAIPHAALQTEQQAEQAEQAAPGAEAVESPRPAPGKVPCAFFLKTGTCAYGDKCKFEHPWDKLPVVQFNSMGLPLRQGQPECAYYLRHGRCGFGPSCKFHHPEPGKAGSTASQEQPATATNAATADAADPAALVPAGPETAAPQPDAVSLPEVQVSVAEQQPDQAASTSALSPQPSSSPAPSAHSAQSMPQMGPQLAVLPPQYVMTLDGAGQAPQSQPQAQQEMQSQPHCLQLGVTGQSSSTPQVQLSAALQLSAAQQLQPQGQTLLSPIQASQSPHVTPATPTASKLPQAVTQAAVSAQPPAGTQQGMAPQLQLQPSSQVATAWLPAATLQPLTGTTAAGEQATPVSTSAQPHLPLPTPTAPQTSAFLPVASVTMQPQLGLHQGIAALPSTLRQQGHLARRSASVPEGSLPAMQPSTQGFLGQPLQAAPASFIPSAGLPMLPSPPQPQRPQQGLMTQPQQPVTQLQSQPQPQQPVTQPQVQHVVTQPQVQQLVVQPQVQQVVTQPQLHPQLQPQQLVAQGHEQVASPQTAPVAQAAAGLPLLQQQPVVLAQGQIVQPAQQGPGLAQTTPQSMVSIQMPAQAMTSLQASSAQAVPLLLPAQQCQIIPSQGLTAGTVQVAPTAGLTPLEQVPKQASSPPRKAGEGRHLEDMSAGLPSLHLTGSNCAHGLEGLSGDDVLKPLGRFGSEELAAPSLNTPAPSERSLATASTTSTSTSLISSQTSSSDTAKAIEAVRQSLASKECKGDNDKDAIFEHSGEQAQTEQMS